MPKGTQVEPGFKPESDPKALFFLAHSFVLTKKVADDLYNIEHIFACGWCWEEVLLSYQHGLTKNQVMHFCMVLLGSVNWLVVADQPSSLELLEKQYECKKHLCES